jgi:hypothetical protein
VLRGRRLRKKYLARRSITAAAKADIGNMLLIAAVNRCATQNQTQNRLVPPNCESHALPVRREVFPGGR